MAFKMKNPSMAKLTKAAGDNRAAMKMKMEEKAAAAKMKREAAMKMEKESMAKLTEKASAMKKDERSYFQRLKDEAKQIGKGILGASDALNEPMGDGIPNDPIKGFKRAYKKEEDKQAKERKGGSATKMKKSPIKASESNNAKRKAVRDEYNRLKKLGTDKSLRKARAMEVENKHGFFTQIKSQREVGTATKMKKASPAKQKMNMVKGPDGKMVPDFAVDGKGANDMKSAPTKLMGRKKKKSEGGVSRTVTKTSGYGLQPTVTQTSTTKKDGKFVRTTTNTAKRPNVKEKFEYLRDNKKFPTDADMVNYIRKNRPEASTVTKRATKKGKKTFTAAEGRPKYMTKTKTKKDGTVKTKQKRYRKNIFKGQPGVRQLD